jgi:dUTP pyrophosphatase
MREPINIEPESFMDVPCGIAIKLPSGMWGMITARSSTFYKRRLFVYQSVIDNGYIGPLNIGVYNPDHKYKEVKPLEALAQLVLMPIIIARTVKVDVLPETQRGARGFGSTDRLRMGNAGQHLYPWIKGV